MSSSNPRLLYILHAYHNRAGTEMHVKALARLLANDFEIYLAYPERGLVHLMRPSGEETHLPGEAPVWPVTPYNQPITENSLRWILETVMPDLIHIQHFIYWPLDVIDLCIVTGKPVAITFHDYYAITPHFTMEGVEKPVECFTKKYAQRLHQTDVHQYLLDRKNLLSRSLGDVAVRIAPSDYTAGVIREVFQFPVNVIEHGVPAYDVPARTAAAPGIVRFGYLGSLIPQKGWESLLAGFERLREKVPQAELHVWGGNSDQKVAGVTYHGVYNLEELPKILSSFDVGVIPSLFRESYSLTLSELWMAGLPVAVSDIGALGERVIDGVNGKKFKAGNVQTIFEALWWYCSHDEWRNWHIPKPRDEAEMADEYRTLYAMMLMRS